MPIGTGAAIGIPELARASWDATAEGPETTGSVAQFDPGKAPQKDPDEKRTYAELRNADVAGMRKIGMDRFVLASDWPAISVPNIFPQSVQRIFNRDTARVRLIRPVSSPVLEPPDQINASWRQLSTAT